MEPKTEPGSPPDFHSTNPNNNFEDKSVHDLVMVLRGACQWETFDRVEAVLENRYMRLREENQKLQQDFEMEILKLKEQLDMEILSRLHAEFEFRKREEICLKGKKVQESFEALLKEVKVNRLADRKSNEELEKKNNEVDVLRRKIVELENEVLELKKLEKKWEEDDIELGVLRKMIGELESKVLELTKSKENAMVGLNIKIGELEYTVKKNLATMSELRNESRKLTEEKCEVEILLKALKRKFIRLREKAASLEEDIILLTGLEEEVPMVDHFEENVGDDEFRNGIVEEADPLPRNEVSHHTLGVSASTQPQSKDVQGASSGIWKLIMHASIIPI